MGSAAPNLHMFLLGGKTSGGVSRGVNDPGSGARLLGD